MTIIDRLKAAAANGDADLDLDIAIHFKQWPYDGSLETMSDNSFWMNTPYTSGVDYAFSLVEKTFPNCGNSVIKRDEGNFEAYIWQNSTGPKKVIASAEKCQSRAIAILTALFTALEGKGNAHADK